MKVFFAMMYSGASMRTKNGNEICVHTCCTSYELTWKRFAMQILSNLIYSILNRSYINEQLSFLRSYFNKSIRFTFNISNSAYVLILVKTNLECIVQNVFICNMTHWKLVSNLPTIYTTNTIIILMNVWMIYSLFKLKNNINLILL